MELLELTEASYEDCVERMSQAVVAGELVAFPTDTVYGLGGMAFSRKVIDKLMAVKPDRNSKPTAILIDSLIRLSQFSGEIPSSKIVHLVNTYWPGPLTVVWHVSGSIPEEFHGKDKTLGYRIPNHEFILDVMRRTERPLWATSANMPGRPAPRLFSELDPMVIDSCDLVIKTRSLLGGKASSVVDVRGKQAIVVREGAIPESDIEKNWKKG